jgi:hypothetical protein
MASVDNVGFDNYDKLAVGFLSGFKIFKAWKFLKLWKFAQKVYHLLELP